MSDSERNGTPFHDSTACSHVDGPHEIDPLRSHDGSTRHVICPVCRGDARMTIWFGSGHSHTEYCTTCRGTGRMAKS
jgi:DnaJ-class molecular chaperone